MANDVQPTQALPNQHNPIALARTYQHGLKSGLWKTVGEAAAFFRRTGIPVSWHTLQRAVEASALPIIVLSLFDGRRRLTNMAALELLAIQARDGLDELVHRSQSVPASDAMPMRMLLDALAGPIPLKRHAGHRKKRAPTELPLPLALAYADGLRDGKWASMRGASVALGHYANKVGLAVQIAGLPPEILSLFDRDDVTFWVGRKILSLARARGFDSLITAASDVPVDSRPLSMREGVAVLERSVVAKPPGGRPAFLQNSNWPLLLAKEYAVGKADGRWRTLGAAEKALGLGKDVVGLARRIALLPGTVLGLFHPDELTFYLGSRLLSVQRSAGRVTLVRRAHGAASMRPRPPDKETIMEILAGVPIASTVRDTSTVTVNYRDSQSRGEPYIRISSSHISHLVKHTQAIQEFCELLLMKEIGVGIPDHRDRRFRTNVTGHSGSS